MAGALLAGCGATSTAVAPSSTDKCALTLTVSPQTVDAAGGQGRLSISGGRECAWSASSSVSWITFKSATQGQGDGTVDFVVARNDDPVSRAGTVTVGDRQLSISQRPGTCTYQLSATSSVVPSQGGRRDVNVRASSGACAWTAASRSNWISVAAGASGKGDGRVTFEVAPTNGPPRTGSLTIADRTVTVTQAEGCNYAVVPSTLSVGAARSTSSLSVSSVAGCPWTAASSVNWITIASGAAGAGPGAVQVTVDSNTGPARSGEVTVAGRTVIVSQAAGCNFQVSPLTLSFIYQGQAKDVLVTTTESCGWTAEARDVWLTVSPTSGGGTMTVRVEAQRNSGPQRTGSVVIAGQTVTATQVSGCDHEFSPGSASFGPNGGSGKFKVMTSKGCKWLARVVNGSGWVTITRGDDGNGTGTVEYRVAANPGPARTAQIVVENEPFTISQSGS